METRLKDRRLYVDVHILQTVPPSCINRDDTGSPKTAVYGGALRARVSSQCWKKAVRDMFRDDNVFPEGKRGIRTKELIQEISNHMRAIDPSIDTEKSERFALDTINIASKNKPIIPKPKKSEDEGVASKSAALFFITPIQAYFVAKLALKWMNEGEKPSRNAVVEALNKDNGVDIALFGRLVAQAPDVNVDACTQVSHSISTHKVSNEYDYFTAVDDRAPEDNVGAGHIGTVEFNSSTLYRYATVAVHDLYKQLRDDTTDAVIGFVRAFVCSMPTGKQNTFANRTLPDAIMVTLRDDQPINLVGAFERPIQAGKSNDQGYVHASARAFVEHADKTYDNWLGKPEISLITGELLSEFGEPQPFSDLLSTLEREIKHRLGDAQ